ncbi:MAG: GHMP kinase [Chloroflexi bacterium]|nr:GHMP kinase [Chloroflexota bacterium]
MHYRAKAPLRISFCGGGTDVPPYPERYGGLVLVATIDSYAHASLTPRDDNVLTIQSLDYDIVARYHVDDDLFFDGELDLVKAVIRYMGGRRGLDLFLRSDAPPGSGLGSSSAMIVALIGVLKEFLRMPLSIYEVAEQAVEIERRDLKIKGGLQDQYACAFGGFNLIEFYADKVVVNPLRVSDEIMNELECRLLLCYTGQTHLSGNILARQIENYEREEAAVMASLHRLKALTTEMKNALLRGKLDEIGALLHETWLNKRQLASGISTPAIEELYEIGRGAGALGGKILGAGGGGYLLFYCPYEQRHRVAEALEAAGGRIVDFSFHTKGLQTWQF